MTRDDRSMKDVLASIAARQKRLQMVGLGCLMVFGLLLGLFMYGRYEIALPICGVMLVFYFAVLRRGLRDYSDEISKTNILRGLAAPLEDAEYLGSCGMTAREFADCAMLPMRDIDDAILLRQGFQGRTDGGLLRGFEMTFHYHKQSEKRNDFDFVSGTFLSERFDCPINGAEDWLLVHRNMIDPKVLSNHLTQRGYKSAKCEIKALREAFIIASRGEGAFPTELAKRILALREKAPRLGMLRLCGEGCMVFLDRRFYTDKTKVRDLPTEAQLLTNPLPERDAIIALFRDWQQGTIGNPEEDEHEKAL